MNHFRGTIATLLASWLTMGIASAPSRGQQPVRSAFPDDSVVAIDTMARAGELAEDGNPSEAVRVLQQLLISEPDKVLSTPDDRTLFVPVRSVVHAFLLANPELLQKYRVQEEPEAAKLLVQGEFEAVERSRYLTPSGLEATLRLAQRRLELGHFEAARIALEGVTTHPDGASGELARAVADLAGRIAAYLPRPEVISWAESLGGKPGIAVDWPEWLTRKVRSPMHESAVVPTAPPGPAPLAAVLFGGIEPAVIEPLRNGQLRPQDRSWIFPTVVGEVVIVNDGLSVRAFDRATLVPIWEAFPDGAAARDYSDEFAAAGAGAAREIEDAATVTVSGDVAVATTGIPIAGGRDGDQRIHAMSLLDGSALWSVDPAWLDSRLAEGAIRGPALVHDGTVVVSVRKQANLRRLTSLYLVGLDLYTGRLLWVRHVASIGSLPWGRTQPRPEGSVIDRGIVYRGDEMGVLTAVEAATGRPRWVRVLAATRPFDPPYRSTEVFPPRDMVVPIVWGDSLVYLESDGGNVVKVDAAGGRILETRSASALGGPRYLLGVGGTLAAIGPTRVAFVRLDDLANGTARLSAPPLAGAASGRAVVTGDRLTVPVPSGLAVMDPKMPESIRLVPLPVSGHLVMADGEADGEASGVLVADGGRLYSYIGWAAAEARLTAHLKARPDDAGAIRTFIELANRAGRNDLLSGLFDRAAAVATGPSGDEASQRELFALLLRLVRTGTQRQDDREVALPLTTLEDPAHVDAVLVALERSANTPRQSVDQLLELAAHREAGERHREAVEAYQRVLVDSSLAGLVFEGPGLPTLAGAEARRRMEVLLEKTGPAPYAAFDRQADDEFAGLTPDADAAAVIAIADRYPVAERNAELWLTAAERAAAAADSGLATASVGKAIGAARVSESIGRTIDSAAWSRLASAAVAFGGGREGSVYRFLRSLGAHEPALTISVGGSAVPLVEFAESSRLRLADAPSRPTVAATLAGEVHQVIAGWSAVETIGNTVNGCPADQIFMVSEAAREFGLWCERMEDGRLGAAWVRPVPGADPVPLRATIDRSVVFWPTVGGGVLECIDNGSGETRWKSDDLSRVLQEVEAGQRRFPKFSTPLDGAVDSTDLLVANDESTVVFVRRAGQAAAFDLESGEALWSASVGAARVFDVQICGEALVVSGAGETEKNENEEVRLAPVLAAFALRSGAASGTIGREHLGEHVRWIRPLDGGDAIVATASGLLRARPQSGSIVWKIEGGPGAGSAAGWVAGDGVFVLDAESSLWRFATKDGARNEDRLETREKIQFPLAAEAVGDRLMMSSANGVLLFEADGTLAGSDAVQSVGTLMQPLAGAGGVVMMEAYADRSESDVADDLKKLRIYVLDDRSARLTDSKRIALPDPPRGMHLLNNKVLIRCGRATIVISGKQQGLALERGVR